MTKSRTKNAASLQNPFPFEDCDFSSQPATYQHDDTPKAFKRLMQFKNARSQGSVCASVGKANVSNTSSSFANPNITTASKKTGNEPSLPPKPSQNLIKFAEAGTKISAKKKAYHKKRDERKRAKKQNSALERDFHNTRPVIKNVRDTVQEPPKVLAKPKKVFKKEIQSVTRGEENSESSISGFSDFDADDVNFSDLE
jgi:hypothetical protein